MKPLFLIGLSYVITFGSCFLLLSLLIKPAHKYQFVDIAQSRRHAVHIGSVPLIGGISIFCSLVLGLLTLQSVSNWTQLPFFLICTLIVVLVGVLDDLRNISAGFRLLIQALTGLLIFAGADIQLTNFGNILSIGDISFGVAWALPISVIAVISAQNASNMIDGIDGLSSSLSLITLLGFGFLAFRSAADLTQLHLPLILSAALTPLILFNLGLVGTKNRVFLGDAGSTLLGFIIVWIMIDFSQGETPIMRPVTALWLFALPLMDMVLISIRRIFRGQSPLVADRLHLHHLFRRSGFSKRKTLTFMLTIHSLTVGVGIIGELLLISETLLFISFLLVFCLYVYFFRHAWKLVRFLRKIKAQ